jgi:hypothetical protein
MFNSKLKQEIAALKLANEQLQEQYNLVHVLLQARQDDCVALQRKVVKANAELSRITWGRFYQMVDKLKVSARAKLPFLSNRILIELGDEIMKVVCDEFGIDRLMTHDHSDPDDSDEDEDEDEDEDD